MTESHASAPGKVILFGEHAVVYGRPAIAVPVGGVRAMAQLRPLPAGAGFRLIAPDLSRDYWLTDAPDDDPLAAIVRRTLRYCDDAAVPAAELTVTSTIPLGRGLGSGAAISTAIARSLAQFLGRLLSPAEVSNLVFEVEKYYHGTPSGIDNTVVAFEQPVYFIKDRPMQRVRVARPLTLLVGDTGVAASTRTVVADLRYRWQAVPERYEGYFDEIGVIARHAKLLIEQETMPVSTLGKLMNENHQILQAIGISHPQLDALVSAALASGAWGAKLSGAGWGGNMIALVPPEGEAITRVTEALLAAGAVGVITTVVGS
jgi:mevalonate kinase